MMRLDGIRFTVRLLKLEWEAYTSTFDSLGVISDPMVVMLDGPVCLK